MLHVGHEKKAACLASTGTMQRVGAFSLGLSPLSSTGMTGMALSHIAWAFMIKAAGSFEGKPAVFVR